MNYGDDDDEADKTDTGDDDPDSARCCSGEVDGGTRVVARVQHVSVADS